MAFLVADQNQVVTFFESGTYGTKTVAGEFVSGNWVGLIQSHDSSDSENIQEIRYTGTASRNVTQHVNGVRDYEGTISYFIQDFQMAGFAFGVVEDTGSPTYLHTVTEANSDIEYKYASGTLMTFPSFTITDSKKGTGVNDSQVRNYAGCVVDSYTISASEGEPISTEVSYKAQSLTVNPSGAAIPKIRNEDTTRPYLWSDTQFHLPSGTKITEVKDFTFTLNNNLETKHYVNGSRVAAAFIPTNRDYELTLTLDATTVNSDTLYRQYWQGGSEFNCMLEMVIDSSTEKAFVVMSGCRITEFSAPTPNEGVNELTMTVKPLTASMIATDLVFQWNPGSIA